MTLVPAPTNSSTRWAEHLTDLWDVSFKELQDNYKEWEDRVLVFRRDKDGRKFRFKKLTDLFLNNKKNDTVN
jgi:hypothetical protein